jgi:hypothetical protein
MAADTSIPPIPIRSAVLDKNTPGLMDRSWSAWLARVAEVILDFVPRFVAIESLVSDVTPGTGEAGKALVLDANRDITSGIRSLAVDESVRWDDIELFKEDVGVLTAKRDDDGDVVLRLRHTDTLDSEFGWDTTVGGSLTIGADAASAGAVRLAHTDGVTARNYANDGDLDILETFDDGVAGSHTNIVKVGGGGAITFIRTSGGAPVTVPSDNTLWFETTASSARLRFVKGGVVRTLISVSF